MAPKDDQTGKRHALNMRTTKEVRKMLEDAAKRSGRSLAQEVEHRLTRSFLFDEYDDDKIGLPQDTSFHFLIILKAAIRLAEGQSGKKWLEDPETYKEVIETVHRVLKNLPIDLLDASQVQPPPASLGKLLVSVAIQQLLTREEEEKR